MIVLRARRASASGWQRATVENHLDTDARLDGLAIEFTRMKAASQERFARRARQLFRQWRSIDRDPHDEAHFVDEKR